MTFRESVNCCGLNVRWLPVWWYEETESFQRASSTQVELGSLLKKAQERDLTTSAAIWVLLEETPSAKKPLTRLQTCRHTDPETSKEALPDLQTEKQIPIVLKSLSILLSSLKGSHYKPMSRECFRTAYLWLKTWNFIWVSHIRK